MTKRLVKKTINAHSATWKAPANVTKVIVTVYDDFDRLIGVNSNNSFALKGNGQVYSTGLNGNGSLGDNTTVSKSSPVPVVGGHSFIQLATGSSHNLALKADGSAWAWGNNTYGALGDNTTIDKSSPVAVVGGHSFIQLVAGSHISAGLKSDGTAWTWGDNGLALAFGALGDNTIVNKSSPVAVVGGHSFVKICAQSSHVYALKEDGSAWAWGVNTYGQLGDNTTVNKSSPVAVVGGHSFIQINVNANQTSNTSVALKSDGSAWTWGFNGVGQLGDNTTVSKSSPVAVVGGHSFVSLSGTAALKSDGSAWTWGLNTSGQLGDNTNVHKSSPIAVVGGHSFVKMSVGPSSSIALKSNGSVWAWGYNGYGNLGDGTSTSVNKSSPVAMTGGHIFQPSSIFINKVILQVTPGTTYNFNFFLTQIGIQVFRNYNARNNYNITLEYYV